MIGNQIRVMKLFYKVIKVKSFVLQFSYLIKLELYKQKSNTDSLVSYLYFEYINWFTPNQKHYRSYTNISVKVPLS